MITLKIQLTEWNQTYTHMNTHTHFQGLVPFFGVLFLKKAFLYEILFFASIPLSSILSL